MNINDLLNKVASIIIEKRNYCSFSQQKEFLDKQAIPTNLVENSYNQYKSQMYLQGKFFWFLANASSWVIYPLIMLINKNNKLHSITNKDAIFNCYDIDKEILPNSLKSKYPNIYMNEKMEGFFIDDDIRKFKKIYMKKYKYSRYFYLKCIMKLCYFNYLIKKYRPKAIIGYSEFTFTSSILTEYCNYLNVKHINIMHGEKKFNIRDSFCSFNEFYVWSDLYEELFLSLKCQANFIKELPPMFLWNAECKSTSIDFTYYLTNPCESKMIEIINLLDKLVESGKSVAVRPHPRYTNKKFLKKICNSNIEIEDSNKISIRESIVRTKYIVSDFSTVLLQGLYAKKQIVIDDVTDPKLFNQMVDLKYGIVYKKENYIKLSTLLKGMNINEIY